MEVRMAEAPIPIGRLLFTVQTAQGVHAVHHQAVVIVDAGQRLPRTQTVGNARFDGKGFIQQAQGIAS